jgi:hypothetical protein
MEPELAFRLRDGRPVYHCYRNDEVNLNDMARLEHHFTLSADAEDEGTGKYVFDWRAFLGKFPWGDASDIKYPEPPQYDLEMARRMCVIQRAYDAGMLEVPS